MGDRSHKLEHLVHQLSKRFGVSDAERQSEYVSWCAEIEETRIGQDIPLSQVVGALRAQAQDPQAFDQLVSPLRHKAPHNLRMVLQLLAEVKDSPELVSFLHNHADERARKAGRKLGSVKDALDAAASVSGVNDATKLDQPDAVFQSKAIRQRKNDTRLASANAPPEPDWCSRPFLTDAIVTEFGAGDAPQATPNVASKSQSEQEDIIVDELLYAFMGISTDHLIPEVDAGGGFGSSYKSRGKIKWRVHESIDSSIATLAERLLPLASFYDEIVKFTEKYEAYPQGKVAHALVSSLREIIDEYLVCLSRLEAAQQRGELSLQRLQYFAQPLIERMAHIAELCHELDEGMIYGGGLLSLLESRSRESFGDVMLNDITASLLIAASKPFFAMLEQWMGHGRLDDDFSEFMVMEKKPDEKKKKKKKSAHKSRFALRDGQTPEFLLPVADKILVTGEYINYCRDYAPSSSKQRREAESTKPPLAYDPRQLDMLASVERYFDMAGGELLKLLLHEYKLMDALRAMKRFFFLENGDYMLTFLTIAMDELQKPVPDIYLFRLQSLFELAIRSSSVNHDHFKDLFSLSLAGQTLGQYLSSVQEVGSFVRHHPSHRTGPAGDSSVASEATEHTTSDSWHRSHEELNGFHALQLNFEVKPPLFLIFDDHVLRKCDVIFRRIFQAKVLELQLTKTWLRKRESVARCLCRTKLHSWIQTYLYYLTTEVIEPCWVTLTSQIKVAKTTKDVNEAVNSCLEVITVSAMLTVESLHDIVQSLFDMAESFLALQDDKIDATRYIAEFDANVRELIDAIHGLEFSKERAFLFNVTVRLRELLTTPAA